MRQSNSTSTCRVNEGSFTPTEQRRRSHRRSRRETAYLVCRSLLSHMDFATTLSALRPAQLAVRHCVVLIQLNIGTFQRLFQKVRKVLSISRERKLSSTLSITHLSDSNHDMYIFRASSDIVWAVYSFSVCCMTTGPSKEIVAFDTINWALY